MSDFANYLNDLQANGIGLTDDVTLTAHPVEVAATVTAIPYGTEIRPRDLRPEWLLAGDIHVVFSARHSNFRRVGSLHFDSDGKLRLDAKRIHVPTVDFFTLYPAPVPLPSPSPKAS